MHTSEKRPTDEQRARRWAEKLGLRIAKVRGEDAWIVFGDGFAIAADPPHGMTLDEVLTFLERELKS